MHRLILPLLILALLVGCSSDNIPMGDDSAETIPTAAEEVSRPQYGEYVSRGLDVSKGAILFFAKAGDVYSGASDTLLRSLYSSGTVKVPAYRVDFAAATGARLTYGVIIPDTFVLLDASGQRVDAFVHPSAEEIKILIQGKIPVPPKP